MKFLFGCSLLCFALVDFSRGNLLNLVRPVTDTPEVVEEQWKKMDVDFRAIMETVLKQVVPLVVRSSSEVEISSRCQGSLLKLMLALRQMKPWALLMMDAFGKVPSGILAGSVSDLGAYDQCLGIRVEKDYPKGELDFTGKYCGMQARPPLPKKNKRYRFTDVIEPLNNLTNLNPILQYLRTQAQFFYFISVRIGICVPSHCTQEDIDSLGEYVGKMVGFKVTSSPCEVKQPTPLHTDQIVMFTVVALLVLVCAVGTTLDVYGIGQKKVEDNGKPKAESRLRQALTSFSVRKNVTALLDTNMSKDAIPCLHGLKFLSITWIIVGHTYLYLNWQLLRGLSKTANIVSNFPFQAIANAFVSVDSFFFASGVLVSFLTISFVDKRGAKSFNIPIFIIKRFWRFLPSTCMLIGLTLCLPFVGSGPLFHESIDVLVNNCRKNWWANLLFINNFLYSPDTCQGTTWYTACDVQLYFLSIIYIFLVYKNVKVSYYCLGFFMVGCIASTVAVNTWQDLPPALLMSQPDPEMIFDYWYYAHFLPHVHLGPYAIGLALGFLIARHKDIKERVPQWLKYVGWIAAVCCNLLVLYATYSWNNGHNPNKWETILYAGLYRSSWICGVAWMVFACTSGFGGIVNDILCWKGFVPLSRLTFLAYLWHGTVIWVYLGNMEGSVETNHMVIVWMYLGHVVVTYFLSFVLYNLYEAPFNRLEKIVLGPFMAPMPKKPDGVLKDDKREMRMINNGFEREDNILNKVKEKPSYRSNGHSSVSASKPAESEFINESFVYKL